MTTRIEFKNVGSINRSTDVISQTKPVGIKTPIRRGNRFGLFDMHTDVMEQIKDNFRNLMLTNHNERVMNVNFGANLRAVLFESNGIVNNDASELIATNIKSAVTEFMPFIELDALEIAVHETDVTVPNNFIRIKVTFTVPGLIKDQKISNIDLLLRL